MPETEVLSMLERAKNSKMARHDYNELLILTKLLITKDTSNFKFIKPGALHKARWMAKLLYSIKMVLFQEKIHSELPPGFVFEGPSTMSKRKSRKCKAKQTSQVEKLVRFFKFVVAAYIPWWITCGSATDAAEHDIYFLSFYHRTKTLTRKFKAKLLLLHFKDISGITSLRKCFLHVFSVTTRLASNDMKGSVANALLNSLKSEDFTKRIVTVS